MNNPPPPFSPGEHQRPRSSSERRSEEFQRNGAPRPIHSNRGGLQSPDGHSQIASGAMRRPFGRPPFPHFEGPRSPPNPKNTRHVPCKFFRTEGGCQAGHQCPFLHSMDDTTSDTPCKYFAKGNCKFGQKCALAHILPDGRRVNRPYPNGMASTTMGAGALSNQLHQRMPALFQNGPPHQNGLADPYTTMGMTNSSDYPIASQMASQPYAQVPTIETGYTSHPESQYGSPPENSRHPFSSPTAAGYLSVLDAPMPASFDSQGISEMARYGPIAASMPSKVFIESPPSSLPRKIIQPSDALRKVHDITYNRDLRTARVPPDLGSSPSVTSGDEGAPPLPPHRKHLQRSLNPHQYNNSISKSLPRGPTTSNVNEDWIAEDLLFGNEEDLLPGSLQELLTPQERIRRVSRTEKDRSGVREAFSGLAISGSGADQTHPSTKFGSPSGASPSRYGALFARQREEEATAARAKSTSTGEGGAGYVNGPSPFGHVGSPLRNSSLHSRYIFGESSQQPSFTHISESIRNINGNENHETLADPSSASALSHQLSHTHLVSSPSTQSHQKPHLDVNPTTSTHQPSTQYPAPPPPPPAPPSYSSILSKSTASSSSSKTLTPPVNPSTITTAATATAPAPGTIRGPPKQQAQRPRRPEPPRKLSGPEARIEEEGRLGSEGGVFSMEADDDDDDPLVTAPLPSVAVPTRKSIWNS